MRRCIDQSVLDEIRQNYLSAPDQTGRDRIIRSGMKSTGYSYGALMKRLDLKLRKRTLSPKEEARKKTLDEYGKLVWDYQQKHSTNHRKIRTTIAFQRLQDTGEIPAHLTYFQISESIRRQRLKNKASSYFIPFERTHPLSAFQVDFTRSVHLEHRKTDKKDVMRVCYSKGAKGSTERVWLGVAIDDASRVTYAHYYITSGESAKLAQDFIMKVFSQKTKTNKSTGEIQELRLLQGLPKTVYTDRGGGFKKTSTRNGLARMGIKHILGNNEKDTLGNKLPTSNKQGRGKVEKMVQTIKNSFESYLLLSEGAGTEFTRKEMNLRLKQWLIKWNSGLHPRRVGHTRWAVFAPAIGKGEFPPENAHLLFSTTVFKTVQRRQVCTAPGVWCKVPDFIRDKEKIEILAMEGRYYTMVNGNRLQLEVLTDKKQQVATNIPQPKETETDFIEGLALRERLSSEIERITNYSHNIGSLPDSLQPEVNDFVSAPRMIADLRVFALGLIARAEETGNISIGPEGEFISSKEKASEK